MTKLFWIWSSYSRLESLNRKELLRNQRQELDVCRGDAPMWIIALWVADSRLEAHWMSSLLPACYSRTLRTCGLLKRDCSDKDTSLTTSERINCCCFEGIIIPHCQGHHKSLKTLAGPLFSCLSGVWQGQRFWREEESKDLLPWHFGLTMSKGSQRYPGLFHVGGLNWGNWTGFAILTN